MLDLTQFEGHTVDPVFNFIQCGYYSYQGRDKDYLLLDNAVKLKEEVEKLKDALEKIIAFECGAYTGEMSYVFKIASEALK